MFQGGEYFYVRHLLSCHAANSIKAVNYERARDDGLVLIFTRDYLFEPNLLPTKVIPWSSGPK